MTSINYKSDFKLFEDGCDFTVPFIFEYRTVFGRKYTASHVDGVFTNCSLQEDGRLMVVFDNHDLPPGILICVRHFYLNDQDFHDGICDLWDKRDVGVVLTIGETDNCEIEVEVPPFYSQGPQGDPGITPHIGDNFTWWIGEEDTGVLAKGQNGATPSIGDNGNWWINGEDTGKPSRGLQGEKGEQGIQGPQGIQGEKGETGPQGPKGVQGENGIDGKTPSFDIGQVSTLEPGSSATASVVSDGTDSLGNPKYKINLGIPKGQQGDVGEVGNIMLSSLSDLNNLWEGLLKSDPSDFVIRWPEWDEINHPTSFPPSSHTHQISEISDLNSGWDSYLKNKPNFATTSSNVASATKLQTTRAIWGQNFNGTSNVTGELWSVTDINMEGDINGVHNIVPEVHNSYNLGTSSWRWANLYSVRGNFSGEVTSAGFISTNEEMLKLSGYSYQSVITWGWESSKSDYIAFRIPGNSNHESTRMELQSGGVGGLQVYGNIRYTGTSSSSSDVRLKTELKEIHLTAKDISLAPSFRFRWKRKGGGIAIGSSAQYWQKLLPDAVCEDENGYLSMSYANIALVSAISIAREVVNMDKRISEIERKINNDITKK